MKYFSKEARLKMSVAKLGKSGPLSNAWKGNEDGTGGSYSWCHLRAKELYGKDHCEECKTKKNDKESKQELDMHCHGHWSNLEEENWICVCRACHMTIHGAIGKLKF